MSYWWESDASECYWVEVTGRRDLGADLKCPATNGAGKDFWSYSLIHQVQPGDVVFHYDTRASAFAGASVAGGPLEERPIVWNARGTYGRKRKLDAPRAGWWLPLYRFRRLATPVALAQLQSERDWMLEWVRGMKEAHGRVAFPFTPHANEVRGAQGYLFKLPAAFVARWPVLVGLAAELSDTQEELARQAPRLRSGLAPDGVSDTPLPFRLKSAEDYVTHVQGGVQRRTRRHEALVRQASEALAQAGAALATPHPIDLLVTAPQKLLCEVKTVRAGQHLAAVREAVGQLYEYRHFLGHPDAALAVLLESAPPPEVVAYVEEALQLLVLWPKEEGLSGGPRSQAWLENAGLTHAA